LPASQGLLKRQLLTTADLTPAEAHYLLAAARAFSREIKNPYAERNIPLLDGKTVVHLFFENSTRTWASFDLAIRNLGGQALNLSVGNSSAAKGETLIDTARNIEAMRCNGFVIRHSASGAPEILASKVSVPVINAGDGFHEHPTQGLLDWFTMEERIGPVKGKTVLIIGDIAHSRVARSNIHLLNKLGAKVAVCGPPTLLPPDPKSMGVTPYFRPEEILPQADVVMLLRIQLERQNNMQLPSLGEYSRFWGLNKTRAKLMKPGAIIMHPGPINRGVEIEPELADSPHSVILDQVTNGICLRMAVLSAVIVPDRLNDWLKEKKVAL
jgi:aspartate carbamoyltransferase catalytic subunit